MYKYQIKPNNLDFLRLVLALSVVFIHAAYLFPADIITQISDSIAPFSSRAVSAFFVISGFLVYMSYEKSKNLGSYCRKRLLRIYPAYFVLILLTACAGIFITDLSLYEYLGRDLGEYLLSNLVFLNFLSPDLPGVYFNSGEQALNGALWTLKIEVMFYISVVFIGLIASKVPMSIILVLMYISSTIFYAASIDPAYFNAPSWMKAFEYQLPSQLRYFAAGIFLYFYYSLIKKYIFILVPLSFFIIIFNAIYFEPLAIAILIGAFFIIPEIDFRISYFGDYSYGAYIYHFPIIQMLTNSTYLSDKPVTFLCTSIVLTMIAAIISWHFIEKNALKHKNAKAKENYSLSGSTL